jgi:hypothetical protein
MMPGIFRDGFDTYSGTGAGVGVGSKYAIGGSTGLSLTTGRFGTGQSLRFGGSQNNLAGTFDSATSTLSMCCGIYLEEFASSSNRQVIQFRNNATYTFGLCFNAGGDIVVFRSTSESAGTELGRTSAGAVSLFVWHTFEMEIVIHDTAGRVTIWIDGLQVLNLTNVDTNNAVGTVNNIRLGLTSSLNPFRIDDLYITNSATKPAKAVRIQTLPVNSDGATLNFVPSTGTSHFAVVDELPASSADYLSATNVGDVSIMGLQDLAAAPTLVEEVTVVAHMAKTDAATRSMNLGIISNGTVSDGPALALNSSGLRHERPMSVDPTTGSAWTASSINNLQLQPKVAL